MNARSSLSLHNQNTSNDDDFVARFVARHGVLETLMRRLRAVDPDGSGPHYVLIGPRGMGKTSLLRRIAISIKCDSDLTMRYVPLRFREEQYNVLTLADFWRNCGEALAEWAEATGQTDLANRLDSALPTKAWLNDEASAAQFNAELTTLKRRAVLLVDNIDLILDALPNQSNWTLRRYLEANLGPIVIGAATQSLKQSADNSAAFYEFFQPEHLDPLDEHETEGCMRALAKERGNHGKLVVEVLNKQPERLKTLHTLTGGNPRVLTLIYRLLEAGQSEEAMADLEILLDQVTPYYKARIEEYQSAQQRAVIDAISLHWDPITTGDLARVTNISTTTLSPLLIKLRKDGLIENVETSGPYAGHQLVERFFNIWYLMRHGTRRTKQKMRWLVAFLTSFYSSRELAEIARRANDKGIRKSWHPDFLSAFDEALACQGQSFMENDQPHVFISTNSAPSKLESAIAQNDATSSDDRLLKAGRLIQNASKFFEAKNWINCKKALDELLTCFADSREPALRELVAGALVDKAITLRMMDDNEAAISTYDETLARFADANEPELRNQVARALANKANTLGQMGDNTAAIAAYDEILTRFADADELELRKRVARALVSKAQMLGQMRENGGAIAACDDVFARFADSNEQELRTQVARALVSKAITLRQMGDRVGAIAACDEVLARFADAIEPDVRRQVARAFVSKAITLRAMGDDRAAIAACDEVIARFADVNEPELRTQVARAYVSKAITFRKIDDNAAAITVCDEVISRFAGTNEAGLREQVARALENKIIALRQMDNNAAVLTICDESFARFGNASEPELQKHVARTLVIKAVTLGAMGDNVGAIAAYDKVLERLADVNELELREQVVSALVNKAVTLGEMGDSAAAVAICNEVYARFARSSELELLVWVARALFQKAATFAKIGDSSAAILAFEQALDFDDQKPKTLPATLIAGARIVLANILLDSREEMSRAETLYLEAASVIPLPANANLVWLYLLASRVLDAIHLKSSLEELPAHGRALIDAGIELINDNFGFATGYLEAALGGGLETGNMDFTDDLDRLLRIAGSKGYGERLIAWFEKTGFAERIAPIYVAFKAFVRTENILLDVNPEVRGPAKIIYDRLDAPRRYRIEIAPKKAQAKRRRVAAREAQK